MCPCETIKKIGRRKKDWKKEKMIEKMQKNGIDFASIKVK